MAEGPTQDTAQRYLPKAQPLFPWPISNCGAWQGSAHVSSSVLHLHIYMLILSIPLVLNTTVSGRCLIWGNTITMLLLSCIPLNILNPIQSRFVDAQNPSKSTFWLIKIPWTHFFWFKIPLNPLIETLTDPSAKKKQEFDATPSPEELAAVVGAKETWTGGDRRPDWLRRIYPVN